MTKRGGGASGNPRLTALWSVDPTAAATEVREALRRTGNDRKKAAAELRIGKRTLLRWLKNRAGEIQNETA